MRGHPSFERVRDPAGDLVGAGRHCGGHPLRRSDRQAEASPHTR